MATEDEIRADLMRMVAQRVAAILELPGDEHKSSGGSQTRLNTPVARQPLRIASLRGNGLPRENSTASKRRLLIGS